MFQITHNPKVLETSRRARKFFRNKNYDQLIELLDQMTEKNKYLDSLYRRAKEAIEQEQNAPLKNTHQSLFGALSRKKQITNRLVNTKDAILNNLSTKYIQNVTDLEQKENFSLESAKGMTNIEKLKFKRTREKILQESSSILVDTLKTKESLKTSVSEEEKRKIEKTLQEKEMKLAQNVQVNLLPKIEKNILPGMDSFVKTINAAELSGDVYDFVAPNEYETLFYLGDVTGHGTAAGLVMSMISCLSHSILAKTTNLLQIVISLNKEVKPKLQKNMFTTMVMCKWHSALRIFSFVGAGHEHILHYHAKTKKVEKISTGGIAIGMLPDLAKVIKEQEIRLENNDVLLLYTDGIDEAWDEKKENMYGTARLMQTLNSVAELKTAKEMGDAILESVKKFQGHGEKTDDITLMVFKRTVGQDEQEYKNMYLKQQLQKDLLADEVIIGSKDESFNPKLKEIQDDFVTKSIMFAAVHVDEKNYFAAREVLKKATNIEPNNKELQEFLQEVEEKITFDGTSMFTSFKKMLLSFFQRFVQKRFDFESKKNQYIASLYEETQQAIAVRDMKKVAFNKDTIAALNPKSPYVNKIEQALINAEKYHKNFSSIDQSLGQVFPLELVKIAEEIRQHYSAEQDYSIKHKKDLDVKKENLKFKMNANTSNTSLSQDHLQNKSENIDVNYQPMSVVDNNDIFGLKRLLTWKQNLNEHDAKKIEPTLQQDKAKNMQWEKGGVMEIQRKKYNKFMATISPMNSKDLFSFIEKLSAFVKAGIPIQKSLEIMQDQAENDGYIYVLDELNKSLDKGKLLSQAMQEFPKQFPEMLIYLVYSGEKSGALSVILLDLAEKMKEQQIIRGKITGAMIYPMVIIFASLTIVVSMLIFIVPRLTKVYKDTGVDLPRITQFIVDISIYLQSNYIFVISTFFGVIALIILFGKTEIGRKIYHKIFLHLPVIKLMVTQNNVMLFASNLGILLENGVQLGEALNIVAKITPNYYYSQEIIDIRKNMISRGIGLSEAMGMKISYVMKRRLFPLELLQVISIGEKVGNLAGMLKSAGAMFSERIRTTVKSLSDLLEPILILCVGLLVATILLSIMLPLFNLGKVIRKQ